MIDCDLTAPGRRAESGKIRLKLIDCAQWRGNGERTSGWFASMVVNGGRIIRDKLFFFGGFQGTFNRSNPPQLIAFVPTAAVLNGDFSTIDGPGCISGGKGKNVIDPTTGLPFLNNQIPVGRFDKVSLALVKAFPVAQNGCGRVTYGIPTTGDDDQEILRMDWLRSSKHTLFGRYYIVDYRNPAPSGAGPLATTAPGNLERGQTATLGDTYAFSPTLLNSAHLTFTRRRNNRGPAPDAINDDSKNLGINDSTLGPNYFVGTVSGYFSLGCGSFYAAVTPEFFSTKGPGVDSSLKYHLHPRWNFLSNRRLLEWMVRGRAFVGRLVPRLVTVPPRIAPDHSPDGTCDQVPGHGQP